MAPQQDTGGGADMELAPEGDSFGFPYVPYPPQQELMAKVYETLERGGVGIFESPTGTGKTLALLCPTVSWLRRRERGLLAEALEPRDGAAVREEWAQAHIRATAQSIADHRLQQRKEQRRARQVRVQKAMALTERGTVHRDKARRVAHHEASEAAGDAEFSIEAPPALPMPDEPPDVHENTVQEAFDRKLQVIYCSRTHSQLAQVLREVRRLPNGTASEELAVVTLGARTKLCINDAVRGRARGAAHLNDLCRAATERHTAPGGCSLKKQAHTMADACLTSMLDIEAMAQRGRLPVGGGCPYYGSRRAVREADILLVPYSSLVNADMRCKLGIKTEGNVLIFDEAHNLLEAINDSNSAALTAMQARDVVDDLDMYSSKYGARLTPDNASRFSKLRQFCALLHRHLVALRASCTRTIGAFLLDIGADHLDLHDLKWFLETTELPRKLRGYVEAVRAGIAPRQASSGAIYSIAELLGALQGSTGSDRILCQAPASKDQAASIRYLSLDAEARFHSLLTSARAIIFTGGTLEPRAEFTPLYAGRSITAAAPAGPHVSNFSGRHVVPSDHIFARYVTHGPAGHRLDFRKDARGTPAQMGELQAILSAAAAATPGGVVFFFPSFEYLATVAPPSGSRLGDRVVFVEQRSVGSLSDDAECKGDGVLRAFSAAVRRDGGAVLLAVSGARLSEGINFQDDLCRLVAVVGLPYPNASDLTLLEKMKFLDACHAKGAPGLTGREFYSARCLKAVNQCVGRSIRHASDWAAILLLDHRYAHANINAMISLWLRAQAVEAPFGPVEHALRAFFAARAPEKNGAAINEGTVPAVPAA